jgi:hypothetical protein
VIREGAFVRTYFPFGHPPEARSRPGPYAHIAYCLGSRSEAGRLSEFLLAYTSSGAWGGIAPIKPVGILEFDEREAARLNQKPFHIDLRCLARVPPSAEWFPAWNEPGRGVIAVADARLKDRILRAAEQLVRSSPAIIQIRGIAPRGR